MDNLGYWEKVKQPVAEALKTIKAGRLKGMSDISPQWRFYAMTETFGPVGIGWKYTVDKQWIEPGSYDQSCAFTNISLYFKHEGEWSAAIPGTGGSAFIAKETKTDWDTKIKSDFLFTSDEAFKMSLTDALSVAMKAIGVAANIYSGNQDYSKYTAPESGTAQKPQQQQPQQQPQRKPAAKQPSAATEKRKENIKNIINAAGSLEQVETTAQKTSQERSYWPQNWQDAMSQLIEARKAEFGMTN